MKKFILCIVLLMFFTATFSQQTNITSNRTTQDYLLKSKRQKTTAWLLLSSGAGLVLTGGVLNAHEVFDPNSFDRKYSTKGTPFVITGIVAMASSIPLFIASSKNKKKALSLSIKNEIYPGVYKNSFVYNNVPSVTIKFKF